MRNVRIATVTLMAITALLMTGCSNEGPATTTPAIDTSTETPVGTTPPSEAEQDVATDQKPDPQIELPKFTTFTIDMNADKWLRELEGLEEGQVVVIHNFASGVELPISGHSFEVFVDGDIPDDATLNLVGSNITLNVVGSLSAGSTVSAMAPSTTVNVAGDIEQGANLTIQGGKPQVAVNGDIHVMSIINLFGDEPKLTQNGKPADENLLDSHIASNPENTTEAHG